ncbi:diiron oxygenase [Nocardioides sp. CER19]|uniref:AurF N-oxygenase family protein n=1 Tax=Nocardioides sp. CER19 TaxID=3038538 RepID=UPI0024467E7B|nr:diiron oxygenase [Nocardioides sp. CER19]MDH2412934.1 diiron oxygenase [Nocardioides sp. CER19]
MVPVQLAKRVVGYRPQGKQSYEDTLRTLSEASVETHFEAFKDIAWDSPELAVDLDDERWILPDADPLGRHPWYRSLPRERRIEVGRHRMAAIVKTGSQFEQLLLVGGTQFLAGLRNGNPEFRYFMHELTEETHHIQMFQEFTNRVCPEVRGAPGWLVKGIPRIGRLGERFPALFFAIVLAGEEPIDHVQKDILRAGGHHPLLDRIMQVHIAEEARHIGFAHAFLEEHAAELPLVRRWVLGVLAPLVMRLGADAIMVPSKTDRAAMGIPEDVVRDVWGDNAEAAKFRRDLFADVRMLFDGIGLRGWSTRWAWRALGVDGRPARYRAEPASAAA